MITRHVKLQCCAGLHALYLQLETQGQRLLTFHFPVGHTHQGLYSKGLYVPKQACLLRLYFHSKGTDCACRGRSVFLGEVSVLRLWDPAVLEFSGLADWSERCHCRGAQRAFHEDWEVKEHSLGQNSWTYKNQTLNETFRKRGRGRSRYDAYVMKSLPRPSTKLNVFYNSVFFFFLCC